MKLYTKTGDDGSTGLLGGQRVAKDDARVAAYGHVDELNAAIGIALSDSPPEPVAAALLRIQHTLFDLGADLACPRPPQPRDADGLGGGEGTGEAGGGGALDSISASAPRIDQNHIADLEQAIDAACEPLPPLTQFILPGGTPTAARLHLARTICRRAERACVTLAQTQPIGDHIVVYLNRLSDLLFALARLANHLTNTPDVTWSASRA